MKRYVNLLPQEAQKDIALEKLGARLIHIFLWILLSLGMSVALLVVGRLYLLGLTANLTGRIDAEQKVVSKEDNLKLKSQLNEFNSNLSNLVDLQQHHAQWSEVLIAFARLIPHDIAIDSIVADRETRSISITGLAKRRESVLQLRENILNSSYFKDVDFPLSNITKPTDVAFHYSFSVSLDALIPKTPTQ